MKEIINYNNKEQYHGYQEWYWDGNELSYRRYRKNYLRIDYTEYHLAKRTNFYII